MERGDGNFHHFELESRPANSLNVSGIPGSLNGEIVRVLMDVMLNSNCDMIL